MRVDLDRHRVGALHLHSLKGRGRERQRHRAQRGIYQWPCYVSTYIHCRLEIWEDSRSGLVF